MDRATERATERATDQATERATERAIKHASDRQSDQGPEQAIDQALDRVSECATDRVTDRLTDRAHCLATRPHPCRRDQALLSAPRGTRYSTMLATPKPVAPLTWWPHSLVACTGPARSTCSHGVSPTNSRRNRLAVMVPP